MKIIKILSFIILIIIALITIMYLSGFYFAWSFNDMSLKSIVTGKTFAKNEIEVNLKTIYNYYYYYNNDPLVMSHLKKSVIFSIISILIPPTILGIIIYIIKPKKQLYGKTRFAKHTELNKAGLLIPSNPNSNNFLFSNGIIAGKTGRKFICLKGQQSASLIAPTRAGKGVGIVLPNCLSYSHSLVVIDIKRENYKISSGIRKKAGQKVYLFEPFSMATSRWNPLDYIDVKSTSKVTDINIIAESFFPSSDDKKSDDDFFNTAAKTLFLGLISFLIDQREYDSRFSVTIGDVLKLVSTDNELEAHLISLANEPFTTELTKSALRSSTKAGEKTLGSIFSTLMNALSPWLNEAIDNATSTSDFSFYDLRKEKTTIYIAVKPNELAIASKIINLFYSQLINVNTKVLPSDDPSLKYDVFLLSDEFTALGKIKIFESAIGYMAGYNLRALIVAQSIGQLESIYGKEGTKTILDNLALRIIYKTKNINDAESLSKMLGDNTVSEKSSKSRSKSGRQTTISVQKRALMLPQEFMQLPINKEIIIYESIPYPFEADKIYYYKEDAFKKRLLNPAMTKNKPSSKQTSNYHKIAHQKLFDAKEMAKEMAKIIVENSI